MLITESYKARLRSLSGIKLTEVELRAVSGRSEKGTLSYYVEDYILNLGELVMDSLKKEISQNQTQNRSVEFQQVRISQNSLLIPFHFFDRSNPNDAKKTEFSLNLSVNLESDSKTSAVLKYGTLNDEFNLQSKHSQKDVSDFVQEIVNRVVNVQQTSN